ncbi:uncharacterized protein [Epargyreus clarus]|uniref:uncharacterized protein n=1 Tax=Epargyreus clarus TaxID=520877 RepID=UPI003C2C60FC
MGIYCEIYLHKPTNGAYVGAAGTIISGNIKYAVDEETVFNKITVSLKGHGTLCIEETQNTNKHNHRRRYVKNETYIDVDKLIHNDEKGAVVPIGSYDTSFSFEILSNLPPTLAYRRYVSSCHVKCKISYYVRIKFSRPGFMKFAKRFKKEIIITSSIMPRLPLTPVIYGGQKKLTQLFTSKPSIVNIKANILNSVLKCGDKIELVYEITNDTDVVIKAVETKLVEVYKFVTTSKEVKAETSVPETDSKAVSIQSGETQEMSVVIDLPSDRESLEFSKLVTRDYFVFIIANLPLPHRNYTLQIPVQIGSIIEENTTVAASGNENEAPPSYWECMNEYNSEKTELDETNDDDNAGTSRDHNLDNVEVASHKK